jgi:hypothetical protein
VKNEKPGCNPAPHQNPNASRIIARHGPLGLTCDECGAPILREDDGEIEWDDGIPAVIVHADDACNRPERGSGHDLRVFLGPAGLDRLRDPLHPELAALIPRLHPGAQEAS